MVNRNKRSEVITTAEEILKLFTQPFQIDEHKIHLSASIGIVADDCSIQRSSELLYHAVLAMKEAKDKVVIPGTGMKKPIKSYASN